MRVKGGLGTAYSACYAHSLEPFQRGILRSEWSHFCYIDIFCLRFVCSIICIFEYIFALFVHFWLRVVYSIICIFEFILLYLYIFGSDLYVLSSRRSSQNQAVILILSHADSGRPIPNLKCGSNVENIFIKVDIYIICQDVASTWIFEYFPI